MPRYMIRKIINRPKDLLSRIMTAKWLIGCLLILLLASSILHLASFKAFAVPHILGGPEPFTSSVGLNIKERIALKSPSLMFAPASYPAAVKILFLRVDFQQDTDLTTTGDGTWADPAYACNAAGAPPVIASDPACNTPTSPATPNDYWVNKARDRFIAYYNEVSYGVLTITVDISIKVYTLPNPMAFYGTETTIALTNLIKDSITAADPDVNFANYDAVLIVHAGAGEESDIAPPGNGCAISKGNTCNDIWSLFYRASCIDSDPAAIGCQPLQADGVNINEAIIMPQTDSQDRIVIDPLGVYTHEFGHWLGLPDLYDTKPTATWDGPGKWSLMGDGTYNAGTDGILGSSPSYLDPWSKIHLGWITPQELPPSPDPGTKTLVQIELLGSSNQVIKLQASTTTPSQYFLLENRQQTGFDAGLPGGGLLVWLIDDAVINANIGRNSVNNDPSLPGVRVIEADGDNALKTYGGDFGSAGDPFPGTLANTAFTPYTTVASAPYAGSAWVYLTNISNTGTDVSLTIGFAPAQPQNLNWTRNVVNTATILTWTANTEADLASYKVYKNGNFLANPTQTQYTDNASISGDVYSITAVDSNGYESVRSAEVTATFPTATTGNGGGCFIATAAYGSYEAPYVKILREFRDEYLIPNTAGRGFVELYYRISPPIADYIRGNEVLRGAVRIFLLPIIGLAAFIVKTTSVQKVFFLVILLAGLMIFYRRARKPYTHS